LSHWNPEHVPLFPLSQPLYPGVFFKLRIFEQRYLRLVRESVVSQSPFAVVPITRGAEVGAAPAFYPWGTLVNIADWEQQPGGLLGITIFGERRVKIKSSEVEKDGLIVAAVDLNEPERVDATDAAHEDLIQLLDDLVAGLQMDFLFPAQPLTVTSLSWRLATILPLDPHLKMALIAENDPEERLAMIRQGIATMIAD